MHKIGITAVLTVLICGCSPDKTVNHEADEHQHEEAGSQFTLFSDNLEFFIEHTPLEVGLESEFLVHVTDLSSYKPVERGNVTIIIDGISATSGQSHVPGIFEVHFSPEKAGDFHAEYILNSEANSDTIEGHVHVYGEHADLHGQESESTHSHESDKEGEITFLKEQAWNNDFMVAEVLPVPFSAVIPTSGEIMAVPGEKKTVVANNGGIVRFHDQNLVQGSPVSRGQLLFTLTSEAMIEHNLKLRYQEALNTYEKSRSEFERHQVLYSQGAISERQLISSRTRFTTDSLRFQSLASITSENGVKVHAPVSGTIHVLDVSEGAYVETGQIMVVISSNRKLMIRADLSQQFFDQLDEIQTANFRPAYSKRVFSIDEMNGRLLAAGVSVAENDHYLPIIFEVENNGELLEGAFTEVYLKTSPKRDVLAVPLSAVSEEQGKLYVYVQVTGESYTKRAIVTGTNDGRLVEVISGLKAGDRVVTEGKMLVKAAAVGTGAVGHGHAH